MLLGVVLVRCCAPVKGGWWVWRQGKGQGCVVGASLGKALGGRLSASSSPTLRVLLELPRQE